VIVPPKKDITPPCDLMYATEKLSNGFIKYIVSFLKISQFLTGAINDKFILGVRGDYNLLRIWH
jgi:hypothetical protein